MTSCALNGPDIELITPYNFACCYMNDLPPGYKILKSLIAPARYSDGPTLYLICQAGDEQSCVIYEQLPDGKCRAWSELDAKGIQQAEAAIYRHDWKEASA